MAGGILGYLDGKYSPPAFDWAAVDLRPGAPFGDLLLTLIEFASDEGAFSSRKAGRRPLASKQFFEDYKLACSRWPDITKVKPLSRLMHENSRKLFGGRYNHITSDGIAKRIEVLRAALKKVHEAERAGLFARTGQIAPLVDLNPEAQAMLATTILKAAIATRRRSRRRK